LWKGSKKIASSAKIKGAVYSLRETESLETILSYLGGGASYGDGTLYGTVVALFKEGLPAYRFGSDNVLLFAVFELSLLEFG
jgi:hypothetical protein